MDDNIGLKSKASEPLANKKKKNQTAAVGGGARDTLAFLRKADEEEKLQEDRRNQQALDAEVAYKKVQEMQHKLDGYNLQQPDSFAQQPSTSAQFGAQ